MDKLNEIANYSMAQLSLDRSGHGVDHTNRVVELSRQVLETLPQADSFITLAAAYLHDTIDDKVVEDEEQAKEGLRVFWQTSEGRISDSSNLSYHRKYVFFQKFV